MKKLKNLWTRPLQALSSRLVILVLVIAVIGFADATYLTVEHYSGVIPPCSVTGGCEKVLTSSYSSVFGIPVSLTGSIYYLLIAIGCIIFLESKHITRLAVHRTEFLKFALFLTIPGLLASLWFTGLQMFVLHSYCIYCLGSAVITTILCIMTVVIMRKFHPGISE
ncbi:MAG: vitamin K epoxide reductase family protein [Candidatus Taylorbacteria bacterium]